MFVCVRNCILYIFPFAKLYLNIRWAYFCVSQQDFIGMFNVIAYQKTHFLFSKGKQNEKRKTSKIFYCVWSVYSKNSLSLFYCAVFTEYPISGSLNFILRMPAAEYKIWVMLLIKLSYKEKKQQQTQHKCLHGV